MTEKQSIFGSTTCRCEFHMENTIYSLRDKQNPQQSVWSVGCSLKETGDRCTGRGRKATLREKQPLIRISQGRLLHCWTLLLVKSVQPLVESPNCSWAFSLISSHLIRVVHFCKSSCDCNCKPDPRNDTFFLERPCAAKV